MSFNEFHFIRPYCLLALLPWGVLIALKVRNKLQQGGWQAVCDADLLPFILQEKVVKQSRLPLIAASLAAFLSIIALAGPSWQRLPMPSFRNAAALVIALDLSRSMDAGDIKPSRLIRARYKIADLLSRRKDGQTALLVYANSAFTVTPLTEDTETINSQLSALSSDIMPAQGSNSALAIQKAVELFKNAGLQQGQILLITDDELLESLDVPSGYQVSVLGVGTAAGAPITLTSGGFLKDASGKIVVPKLNARRLQIAAQSGGGIYQQISDSDADIERLSQHFEQIAKRGIATKNDLLLENWEEAGVWLLLPVLILSAFSFRRGVLGVVFVCVLPLPKNSYAFEWQDLWQTPDQQAQQRFDNGDYDAAAKQFTDPAWQAAAQYKADSTVSEQGLLDARSDTGFYNQGNVLAKSGQLEKAIEAYDQALKLNPDHEDAKYNKAVVEDALEKQKEQQQDENKDQDQGKDQQNKEQQNQERSESEQDQDKSGESEQNNQEQGGQSEEQDAQEQQQNKQQESSDAEKENESEPEQQQSAEADPQEVEPPSESDAAQLSESEVQDSEQQQANEQWLKRIPDDPSGLLKRKFLYQYGRQQQPRNNNEQW